MSNTLRRYYTYHKMDVDDAADFDEKLVKVLNRISNGKVSAPYSKHANEYGILLEIAIQAILEHGAENGDSDCAVDVALTNKLAEIRSRESKITKLVEIYERMDDLDLFVEFCEQSGIDNWAEFLERDYVLFKEKQVNSWTDRAKDFLKLFMPTSELVETAIVKMFAEQQGIIDTTSEKAQARDWSKLRVLAHRLGYTKSGHHGKWMRIA